MSILRFLCSEGRRISRYGGSAGVSPAGRRIYEAGTETERHKDLLAHATDCEICRRVIVKLACRKVVAG